MLIPIANTELEKVDGALTCCSVLINKSSQLWVYRFPSLYMAIMYMQGKWICISLVLVFLTIYCTTVLLTFVYNGAPSLVIKVRVYAFSWHIKIWSMFVWISQKIVMKINGLCSRCKMISEAEVGATSSITFDWGTTTRWISTMLNIPITYFEILGLDFKIKSLKTYGQMPYKM